MRTLFASVTLLAFTLAVGAEDFFAVITKVETKDGKTTISGKRGKKDEAKEFTATVAKGAKVQKGKYNKEEKKFEDLTAIEGGFGNEMFTKASSDSPVFGMITTDKDGNVTAFTTGKKKKKN